MGRIRTIQRAIAGATLVATAVAIAAAPVRAQQLPSDEPLFVTASVDNDQPYIGQQITYISKIYQRADFPHRFRYEPPSFSGFWNPRATEKEPPLEYRETINSTEYGVFELRTILFPSVVETLNIEPGVLTASARPSEGPIVVESIPVPVDVRPLPTGGPSGFTGAVGRFEVSAGVDTTTARMNESVQLTVRVEGEGNIEALPAPSWPKLQGWREVESPTVVSSEVIDGKLVGSRTYEIVLVPETASDLTVPEISYTYFDPDLEEYNQTTTSPIVVTIAAADGAPPLPPSSAGGAEDERTSLGAKRIRAAPPALRKSGGAMTDSAVYWAMWCLPLLAIAGAAVLRRRRDAREAALADSRRRNALPNARSTLARAEADGDDHSVAAADAVLSYVSDRFGVSLTGLTREALVERLMDAGVANELAQQIEDTLASGEAARYAPESPSAGHGEDRIRHTTQLLAELDGATET